MKRENVLRRRLESQTALSDAVTAMKSLAAHHYRTSRAALPPAIRYREGIERAAGALEPIRKTTSPAPPGLLVVASDLGLCGGYSSRIARFAEQEWKQRGVRRVYCVGRRPKTFLAQRGVPITRLYPAPTSVVGLTTLLLQLTEDLLDDYLSGQAGSLYATSARFEGAGAFTPVCTRLLPLETRPPEEEVRASRYVSRPHLAVVAVRELFYITLYEILLASLASEHGARLVATESAHEWLDSRMEATRRQLASVRREAATQEVIDIAASARLHRRGE